MYKLLVLCFLALSGVAQETIEITPKQQDDLGVKIQTVSKIEHLEFGPYNGVVVLDKKDIVFVSPKIDVVVENIYVRELEHVKKGQKLVSYTSNALLGLQQNYIEALLESEASTQNYNRNKKLAADGIIPNKRLLESKKSKQSSDLKVRLSGRNLLSNGFSSFMLKKLKKDHNPIYKITKYATRSGIVRKVSVNIGEYIAPNKTMLEIYADGARFVEISLPVKNVENISLGDTVRFSTHSAKVVAIGSIVDSTSQSVTLRAKIEARQNIMINRVYESYIAKKVQHVYKVKKTALVFDGSQALVFKKSSKGFVVVRVSIVKEGNVCYMVEASLQDGDEVAASSTSALLSAMESGDE